MRFVFYDNRPWLNICGWDELHNWTGRMWIYDFRFIALAAKDVARKDGE